MNGRNKKNRRIIGPVRLFGRGMALVNRLSAVKRISGCEKLETQTWEYCHPKWPLPSDGFSVLFVSDIHYGPLLSRDQFERLAGVISSLDYECLLFGGDFGEFPEDSPECISLLAPLLRGRRVIAVPGNHDLREDGSRESFEAAVREAGWEMPLNACIPLDGGAVLAGLDDFRRGSPDIEKTRQAVQGAPFVMLLTHNPDVLPEIRPPFYHLALCGHTHGGQVTVRGRAILSSSEYRQRYLSGWKRENGADILVTNGVGTTLLPVRLGAVPQVNKIVFRHGPEGYRLLDRSISGYAGRQKS